MTKNELDEHSSSESGKNHPGDSKGKEEHEGTYHDASRTESEALRAMMGKKKKADNGNNTDADGNVE
jgi:hypothetical protein